MLGIDRTTHCAAGRTLGDGACVQYAVSIGVSGTVRNGQLTRILHIVHGRGIAFTADGVAVQTQGHIVGAGDLGLSGGLYIRSQVVVAGGGRKTGGLRPGRPGDGAIAMLAIMLRCRMTVGIRNRLLAFCQYAQRQHRQNQRQGQHPCDRSFQHKDSSYYKQKLLFIYTNVTTTQVKKECTEAPKKMYFLPSLGKHLSIIPL